VSVIPLACRSSAGTAPSDGSALEARGDGGDGGDRVAIDRPDAAPCASSASSEFDLRIELDPLHRGFAPYDVVAFGAGTRLPLFALYGSGEGADVVRCSEVAVDGGAASREVRVECQDGPQSKAADVQLYGDRLEVDVTVDGRHMWRRAKVKPCAQLAVAELALPSTAGPASARACPDAGVTRPVDGFLRRGEVESASGATPIWLEVPALHVRQSLGKSGAGAGAERCAGEVTRRGWAHVRCGEGDGALYARVIPLPGEIVVDRAGVGRAPRQRTAIPCDVTVVLHDELCTGDCTPPP
jgi:hypothetical protein